MIQTELWVPVDVGLAGVQGRVLGEAKLPQLILGQSVGGEIIVDLVIRHAELVVLFAHTGLFLGS